jgi:hypothetical protein
MRRFLIAALVVVSSGCLNEDVVGSATATGVYGLRTINNSQLPYKLPASGGSQTEVVSDTITLFQGNTYAETIHRRVTTNGQVTTETIEDAGAYSFFNITVTLTSGRGRPERRGRIEETSMIIIEEGLTSVYRK